MKPTVGRIVHYTSYGTPGGEFASECRAAIIAGVKNDSGGDVVDLVVFNPQGIFFNRVPYDAGDGAGYSGGTWHWPERE